jgi:hypothetical protein
MGRRLGHAKRTTRCRCGNGHGITSTGANQIVQRLVNLRVLTKIIRQACHHRFPVFDEEASA